MNTEKSEKNSEKIIDKEKENSSSDEKSNTQDDPMQNYYAEWSNQHEIILVEWVNEKV